MISTVITLWLWGAVGAVAPEPNQYPALVTELDQTLDSAMSGEASAEDSRRALRSMLEQIAQYGVELAADAQFDIHAVELGGRRTEAIGNVGDLAIPHDRHFDFAARWVSAVVLTVVDAETREVGWRIVSYQGGVRPESPL